MELLLYSIGQAAEKEQENKGGGGIEGERPRQWTWREDSLIRQASSETACV